MTQAQTDFYLKTNKQLMTHAKNNIFIASNNPTLLEKRFEVNYFYTHLFDDGFPIAFLSNARLLKMFEIFTDNHQIGDAIMQTRKKELKSEIGIIKNNAVDIEKVRQVVHKQTEKYIGYLKCLEPAQFEDFANFKIGDLMQDIADTNL